MAEPNRDRRIASYEADPKDVHTLEDVMKTLGKDRTG